MVITLGSQVFHKLDETDSNTNTRMHSSRMRTGRSLTICCSMLPGGGCLLPGGCLIWGGVCSRGVSGRGVSAPGGYLVGGVSAPGGVCSQGCLVLGGGAWSWGCVPGPGGCITACTEVDPHPPPLWTEFLTHACENITLAQLRCGQ